MVVAGMECSVYSHCGNYAVHFRSDGAAEFLLHVRDTPRNQEASRCYSASLTPDGVDAITSGAGVRKSFSTFAEMTYHALIGSRSPSLTFYVETQQELASRIRKDIEERGGEEQTPPYPIEEPDASQLFLTIDYDVDFTRAIFPLPLSRIVLAGDGEEAPPQRVHTRLLPTQFQSGNAKPPSSSPQLEKQLSEAVKLIQMLNKENTELKGDNAALLLLNRDQLREMQKECKRLADDSCSVVEVNRLKEKNVRLRMELVKSKEEAQEMYAVVEQLRRQVKLLSQEKSPLHSKAINAGVSRRDRKSRLDTPPMSSREVRDPPSELSTEMGSSKTKRYRRLDTPPSSSDHHNRIVQNNRLLSPYSRGAYSAGRQRSSEINGVKAYPTRAGSTSSRGSSNSSQHDRLYRASTAASRQRERQSWHGQETTRVRTSFRP